MFNSNWQEIKGVFLRIKFTEGWSTLISLRNITFWNSILRNELDYSIFLIAFCFSHSTKQKPYIAVIHGNDYFAHLTLSLS